MTSQLNYLQVIGCTEYINEQSAIGKCVKTAWKNALTDEQV